MTPQRSHFSKEPPLFARLEELSSEEPPSEEHLKGSHWRQGRFKERSRVKYERGEGLGSARV